MLAECSVVSEEALVHVPRHLTFDEAATLPCAAVTAWVALTGHRWVIAGTQC
jgi:NADPH:quinone reductase-like Zn-dependent oxidoreductase